VNNEDSDYLSFNTFLTDKTTIVKGCDLVCSKSLVQCNETVSETVSLNPCGWTLKFDFQLDDSTGLSTYLAANAAKVLILDLANGDVYLRVYVESLGNTNCKLVVETPNENIESTPFDCSNLFSQFLKVGIAYGPCKIALHISDGIGFFSTDLSEPTPFPDNCGFLCIGWTTEVEHDDTYLPLHGCFDNLYILSHPLVGESDLQLFAEQEKIRKHEERCYWVNRDGRDAEIKKLSIPICFDLCGGLCDDAAPVCESLTIEKTSGQWNTEDFQVAQTIIDINSISEWPGCFTLTKIEGGRDDCSTDPHLYHANLCLDFMDLFCCPLTLKNGEAVRVRVQYLHTMNINGMSLSGCYVGAIRP
jgi:hypothetical protein